MGALTKADLAEMLFDENGVSFSSPRGAVNQDATNQQFETRNSLQFVTFIGHSQATRSALSTL